MNRSEGQWIQPELSSPVHRGLLDKPEAGAPLGMHWTSDPSIARSIFATPYGHVVHAEVPISSVETNTEVLRRWGVSDAEQEKAYPEKEVPIKSGTSIKVTGITSPDRRVSPTNWKPGRTRRYNPAREMKA